MSAPKPVVLCILDGWGLSEVPEGNAPLLAKTPNFDRIMQAGPKAQLITHGPDVGLPRGQMPVYETASPADQRALGADPGQAWFDNILRMRGAKLRDFYAIQRWATHFELVLHDNLTRSADATPAFLRRLRDEYGLPVRKPGLFKAADAKQREYLAGFNARNFYFNRGARCERPKCAFDARSLAYVNEHLDAAAERHLGVELVRDVTVTHKGGKK